MEDVTREEIEVMVDEYTQPSDGTLESAFRLMGAPHLFMPLAHIREAIKSIKDTETCECGKPSCMSKGIHRGILQETIFAGLPALERLESEMREQAIDGVLAIANCKCNACRNVEKSLAALWN